MQYEILLIKALASPLGIVVQTNNSDSLRQKLYAIKRKDPAYAGLSFLLPANNPEQTLFIIKTNEAIV